MSTKIYNGKKMPIMTMKEFNRFITSLRKKSNKVAREYITTTILNKCIYLIDKYYLIKHEQCDFKEFDQLVRTTFWFEKDEEVDYTGKTQNIRSLLFIKMVRLPEQLESSVTRNVAFDLYFKISFFILKDKILLLPMYEQRKIYDSVLKSYKKIENYEYFDNTDRPDEISKKLWTKRRKDWEALTEGNAFELKGLNIDIVKEDISFSSFMNMRDVKDLSTIPHKSYEKRIFDLAKEKMLHKRFSDEIYNYQKENPGKKIYGSFYIPIMSNFAQELKESFEGTKVIKNNDFSKELQKNISVIKKIIPDVNINSYINMSIKPWTNQLELFK